MGYLGWVGGGEHMLCFNPVHLPPLKHTEINFTTASKTPFLLTQHVNRKSSVDLFAKKNWGYSSTEATPNSQVRY